MQLDLRENKQNRFLGYEVFLTKACNYFNDLLSKQTNIVHFEQLLVLLSYCIFRLPEHLKRELDIMF